MGNNNSNFFEQQRMDNIERVTLAEPIELPELPEEPLTLAFFGPNVESLDFTKEYKISTR